VGKITKGQQVVSVPTIKENKRQYQQPPRANSPQVHESTLLCSTTNPFSNYYYAVNDGANAQNIEAEDIERKRVKW